MMFHANVSRMESVFSSAETSYALDDDGVPPRSKYASAKSSAV